MRLWTLDPRYLDARGLVALWREALLAKAVLSGKTKGYTKHPQLARFQQAPAPLACIRKYLDDVHAEACRRGYRFNRRKIGSGRRGGRIRATSGQVRYEWRHLKAKLARRSRGWLAKLPRVTVPDAHPLFRVVPGGVEAWEVVADRRRTRGSS